MDTSEMLFDIGAIPEGETAVDFFPKLKSFEEFKSPNNDTRFRIVALMVDDNSPFVKTYKDSFALRLDKVFEYMKHKDDKLKTDILERSEPAFAAMVHLYLVLLDNLIYEMWYTLSEGFHLNNQTLREKLDLNDQKLEAKMVARNKIKQDLPAEHKRLVALEKEVFTDSVIRKIVKEHVAKIHQPAEQFALDKQVI